MDGWMHEMDEWMDDACDGQIDVTDKWMRTLDRWAMDACDGWMMHVTDRWMDAQDR